MHSGLLLPGGLGALVPCKSLPMLLHILSLTKATRFTDILRDLIRKMYKYGLYTPRLTHA